MFRIKICGLTSAADAHIAAAAGADAIGLNFFPLSPRCVSERQAHEIIDALPAGVAKVGVFVNSPASEVRTLAERLGLDFVQLHGDEPPALLSELAGLAVIRALRPTDMEDVFRYLAACRQLGSAPAAMLVDAHSPGEYGGTGTTADWPAVAAARDRLGQMPLVLAGGLNSANVAQAIAAVRPAAVDTASGVESAPGKKSAQLVRAFVDAARQALASQVPA